MPGGSWEFAPYAYGKYVHHLDTEPVQASQTIYLLHHEAKNMKDRNWAHGTERFKKSGALPVSILNDIFWPGLAFFIPPMKFMGDLLKRRVFERSCSVLTRSFNSHV